MKKKTLAQSLQEDAILRKAIASMDNDIENNETYKMVCEGLDDMPEESVIALCAKYLMKSNPTRVEEIANEIGRDAHLRGRE